MGNSKAGSQALKILAMVGLAGTLLLAAAAVGTSRAQNANDSRSISRAEAVAQALKVGRTEAKRPVKVSRATRTGRSTFLVVVAWTQRPPIGIQSCSLKLTVSKKGPRSLVTSLGRSVCGSVRLHQDLDRRFQRGPGPKYCPADVEDSWNAEVLEGMTLEEATVIAAANGCQVRVARRDGVDLPVTMDFRVDRLNLAVEGPDQQVVQVLSVA